MLVLQGQEGNKVIDEVPVDEAAVPQSTCRRRGRKTATEEGFPLNLGLHRAGSADQAEFTKQFILTAAQGGKACWLAG